MALSTLDRSFSRIYLSQLTNTLVLQANGQRLGKLKDLVVHNEQRPVIAACIVKTSEGVAIYDWKGFVINEEDHEYKLICKNPVPIALPQNSICLNKQILDKQIVDINDKKVVRVNDISLAFLTSGSYPVAVDVGLTGLLRRLGVIDFTRSVFSLFNRPVPSRLILWNDIGILYQESKNIKLSVAYAKLHLLHPSDLSDIIEDLDSKTRTAIFTSLDEEKAADVLEEMEDDTAVALLEDLPVEKAADVLEKMPTDEVADILDDLNEDKAEILLQEMDVEKSTEIRELMEYPEDTAGSLMTRDFLSFSDSSTPETILRELRIIKPKPDMIYSINVVDHQNKLIGVVPLRDIVTAEVDTPLRKMMNAKPLYVMDTDPIESLVTLVSKYNLLAVPVVQKDGVLVGTIIIDDIVFHMIKSRRSLL